MICAVHLPRKGTRKQRNNGKDRPVAHLIGLGNLTAHKVLRQDDGGGITIANHVNEGPTPSPLRPADKPKPRRRVPRDLGLDISNRVEWLVSLTSRAEPLELVTGLRAKQIRLQFADPSQPVTIWREDSREGRRQEIEERAPYAAAQIVHPNP